MQTIRKCLSLVGFLSLILATSAAAQDADGPVEEPATPPTEAPAQPPTAEPAQLPSEASVDEETTAAARALFDQGMAAVDAGDHQTGADLFARSVALRDSPVTRTNLALALIETGRLVAASEHLRVALRMASPDSPVRAHAARLLEGLRPRLGRLRITLTGDREEIRLLLDGEPVPAALIGVDQPADPGPHTVTLRRGDELITEQRVEVVAGRSVGVTLIARSVDAEESGTGAAPSPSPEPPSAPSSSEGALAQDDGGVEGEAWFWILIAGLAVAAGAGITAAIVASSSADPAYTVGSSGRVYTTLLRFGD